MQLSHHTCRITNDRLLSRRTKMRGGKGGVPENKFKPHFTGVYRSA